MEEPKLKRMSECTLQTALEVWNEGFKGYFVDMTLTLDKLLLRLTTSRVSPEHSLIAIIGDKPVGFLCNAMQVIGEKKFAWNGGTGVIPEYRGKGVGKALVEATIEIYKANSVDVALLEAISTNFSAISLYKRFGYEVFEELTYLQSDEPVVIKSTSAYEVRDVPPSAAGTLEFYRELSPWQCQWQTLALTGGEAIVVLDVDRRPIGYALFERRYDELGKIARIALFQCEVAPGRSDEREVAKLMLMRIFGDEGDKCQRTTVNFPKSNEVVVEILESAGFTTFIEQVHMMRKF